MVFVVPQFLKSYRTPIVLSVFSLTYLLLAVTSYTQESATFDEPQHLTAGYVILKLGDHRIYAENPPFLDLWAALPLLVSRVAFEASELPTLPYGTAGEEQQYCHRFLYELNDADRLLYRARFMIVLLGLLLGVLVFCWARDLFGWPTACAALVLYGLEPNMLAHARLVTTDLGVTCFIFGAVYFLWRTTRRVSWSNVLGLSVFFALAQISKYTALLLFPIAAMLLIFRAIGNVRWACDLPRSQEIASRRGRAGMALLILLHLILVSYITIWAAYSFRYTGDLAPLVPTPKDEVVPTIAAVTRWVDRYHLLPNDVSMGFLIGQAKLKRRAGVYGEGFRTTDKWYYLPVLIILKTPLLLVLLILLGLAACVRRWRGIRSVALFIVLPMVVLLGAALWSGFSVGLRYVLPIYPFGVLLAVLGIEPLLARSRGLVIVLAAIWVVEFAVICPHYLASSSELIGGPGNGYKYMADSDLDWGQDLKGLKKWMDENGVQHINLAYFGTANPAYYGISYSALPGTDMDIRRGPSPPLRLPGYIAISVTHLHGIYLSRALKAVYGELLPIQPRAVIGHSIHVYWLDQNGRPSQD